jgi:hypothetical protein
MRCGTILAAVVFAALSFAGNAFAGVPDGPGPFADYVVDYHQGCAIQPPDTTTCIPVFGNRSDPTAALGPNESPPGPNQNPPLGSFYSMGFSGLANGTSFITLGFDNPICNTVGNDLAIELFEITTEPYPNETVQVFVSQTGAPGSFVFAGTVSKDGTVGIPAGLTVVNFVKLVEVSNPTDFVNTLIVGDGYDLDAVKAISSSCPSGKLEICKARDNGMAGRTFQYSLNGGPPISVKAGFCSGPITANAGANRVVELQSNPPTDVSKITTRPSARLLSTDLPNRTGIVQVASGSTAANETVVTFTNEPAGGTVGDLKICKLTQAPAYLGQSFSFRVNGGSAVSTEANPTFSDPATWTCRIVGTFQTGSHVTVQELIPPGAEVDFIDADPGANLIDFNTDTGTAIVNITGPVTTVIFDNEPIPPAQTGFIEVCKDAANGDPFVTGPFDFTVAAPDGSTAVVTTFAGQCTQAFRVASGIVRVTEQPKANTTLVDVFADPIDREVDSNIINRTIDVEVPVSSSVNDETQVHFVNQRNRAQVKVCKILGTNSSALVGQTFSFSVSSPGLPTVTQGIQAAATPNCFIFGNYPVGNTVTVTENLDHSPMAPGEFIDTTGEGTFPVASGVNQFDVTNTAVGQLEVCKARITYFDPPIGSEDRPGPQPTFRFRIDGGAIFSVQAGKCSPPKRVTPGSHTVTELAESDYELAGVTVSPANRNQGVSLANRTVTVDVPYAGNGNGETAVTFINRVKTGQVKVCKSVPLGSADALFNKPFSWDVYVQNNNGTTPAPFTLGPISAADGCTEFSASFPILNTNGTKKQVGIHEQGVPSATWDVTSIVITSGTRGLCYVTDPGVNTTICPYPVGSNPNLANGDIDFYLGPDSNVITYTNRAK